MWWSGDIDGHEHVEQSRSRDHYLAWQRERLLAMLARGRRPPRRAQTILDDLQAGRAARVLEAYDEVPGVLRRPPRARPGAWSICSNWDWDLEPAIAEAGLAGRFDTVVSSAWAGARKPHPRIYRYLLEQAAASIPHDVLFVGDTWGPDVEGPLAAGMTAGLPRARRALAGRDRDRAETSARRRSRGSATSPGSCRSSDGTEVPAAHQGRR